MKTIFKLFVVIFFISSVTQAQTRTFRHRTPVRLMNVQQGQASDSILTIRPNGRITFRPSSEISGGSNNTFNNGLIISNDSIRLGGEFDRHTNILFGQGLPDPESPGDFLGSSFSLGDTGRFSQNYYTFNETELDFNNEDGYAFNTSGQFSAAAEFSILSGSTSTQILSAGGTLTIQPGNQDSSVGAQVGYVLTKTTNGGVAEWQPVSGGGGSTAGIGLTQNGSNIDLGATLPDSEDVTITLGADVLSFPFNDPSTFNIQGVQTSIEVNNTEIQLSGNDVDISGSEGVSISGDIGGVNIQTANGGGFAFNNGSGSNVGDVWTASGTDGVGYWAPSSGGSSLTQDNGLTLNSNVIGLGGTITKNTSFALGSNIWSIQGSSGSLDLSPVATGMQYSGRTMTMSGNGFQLFQAGTSPNVGDVWTMTGVNGFGYWAAPSAGPTPNIQQVADQGSTTTTPLTVEVSSSTDGALGLSVNNALLAQSMGLYSDGIRQSSTNNIKLNIIDPDFSLSTVINQSGSKLAIGQETTGNAGIETNQRISAADPVNATDLVTKQYFEANSGSGSSTGLESLTETNTGWRLIGRDPANYGDIGNTAVDLSISNGVSTTFGATGIASFAAGQNVTSSGTNSVAIGSSSTASGSFSVALGGSVNATAAASVALGFGNTASGQRSFAINNGTTASGDYSFAGGSNGESSGDYSFTFGLSNNATSNYGIAMGLSSTASGLYSAAIGQSNTTNTRGSVALGGSNITTGDYSIALGLGNESKSYGEVSIGLYGTDYTVASTNNFQAADRVFNVGNGANSAAKSDALTIFKNGNIILPSTELSNITDDKSIVTKEYVDSKIIISQAIFNVPTTPDPVGSTNFTLTHNLDVKTYLEVTIILPQTFPLSVGGPLHESLFERIYGSAGVLDFDVNSIDMAGYDFSSTPTEQILIKYIAN